MLLLPATVENSCSRSVDDTAKNHRYRHENPVSNHPSGLGNELCFADLCQQTSTPDPQLREKLIAAIKKHTDALDKNDAAAVAANFTENGILVTPDGPIFGRDSIEKYYVGVFKQVQLSENLAPVDDDSPHIIGTAGNQMWATGKYSATVKGQNFGPVTAKGCWSVIREGDDWKIRMLTFNTAPPPAATPSPTATPSNK